MKTPKTTIWEMHELTPIKHRILRGYLERWLPALLSQCEHVYILDGFCGPGEYVGGKIGSPLIAIDVLRGYTSDLEQQHKVTFLFIDNNNRRCNHLYNLIDKQKQSGSSNISHYIETGDFARKLRMKLTQLEKSDSAHAPMFAFIDPFGISHTPMSVIARILRQANHEILLTFMYEPINRFLNDQTKPMQRHLTELFGSEQWRAIDLAGDREQQICDLYYTQLRSASNVKYICPFRLKNSRNATDYFLIFGTYRRESAEQMKEVFWEIDPVYGCAYSLYEQERNAYQLQLFPPQPNYSVLSEQIIACFCGTTITLCTLEEYILAKTTFRLTGYKEHVLKPLELSSRICVVSPNTRREIGEYDDTDLIRFL